MIETESLEREFVLGSGFSSADSTTLFLASFIVGMTLWAAWEIWQLFVTWREDKGNQFGEFELIKSSLQVVVMWTIALAFVLF